jgi:hypothetical protein
MWRFSFCFFGSSRWRIEVAKAVIKGGEFVLFVRDLYILVFEILLSEETEILNAGNKYTFSSKGLKKVHAIQKRKGEYPKRRGKKKKPKPRTRSQQKASISTKPRHPSAAPSSSLPAFYYTVHSMAHQQNQY